jgi:hypothetical protein
LVVVSSVRSDTEFRKRIGIRDTALEYIRKFAFGYLCVLGVLEVTLAKLDGICSML